MPKTPQILPDTLKVRVLKKHIKRGTPHDPISCPIALAIGDMGYSNSVGHAAVHLFAGGRYYKYGHNGKTFIHDFDYSLPVKSCYITLTKEEDYG